MERSSSERGMFVGREAEMAVLRGAVDEALEGRARFMLLSGDPGIGKSRTAQEVAAYAHGRGVRVLWGRCYENDGAPPFWPWVQVLRAALAAADEASLPTLLGDNGAYVAHLVPELRTRLPDLPQLPASVSDENRQLLFEGVGALLRNIARTRPLAIVVDDLQGADQPSVLLLRSLIETLAGAPVLVLGCCRSAALSRGAFLGDLLAALVGADPQHAVKLDGLSAPEVTHFIEAHTGAATSADLVDKLCTVTEGNLPEAFLDAGGSGQRLADPAMHARALCGCQLRVERVTHQGMREAIRVARFRAQEDAALLGIADNVVGGHRRHLPLRNLLEDRSGYLAADRCGDSQDRAARGRKSRQALVNDQCHRRWDRQRQGPPRCVQQRRALREKEGELANQLQCNLDVQARERARHLSNTALAMARRLGEPEALCDALTSWYQNCWRGENLDERLAVADELIQLGERQGNPSIAAEGALRRAWCVFESGDLHTLDEEIDRCQRYAEGSRLPSRLFWAPFMRATLAITRGQYDEAERWATAAFECGQRAKEVDALPPYMLQMTAIRNSQGRVNSDALGAGVQWKPDYEWQWAPWSALIVFSINLGMEDAARERYEQLAAQDFHNIPIDIGFLDTLASLAVSCSHFKDVGRARVLYSVLRPYATRNLTQGNACGCWGSGAHYLALLAATLSFEDEAVQYFEQGIAHNASMGARPHCAVSQFNYARFLITRSAPGDRGRAATLLQTVFATASELGMAQLAAAAKALLEV